MTSVVILGHRYPAVIHLDRNGCATAITLPDDVPTVVADFVRGINARWSKKPRQHWAISLYDEIEFRLLTDPRLTADLARGAA